VAWATETALRGSLAVFDARVIVSSEEQDEPDRLGKEPDLVKLPPVLVPPEMATMLEDESNGQGDLPL